MTAPRAGRRKGTSDSKQQILEAARSLFAENGYQRTTMRMIADRAGVDPSLAIYFFSSKEQLFTESMPAPSEEALAAPKLLAALPRAEAARALSRRILESVNSPDDSNILGMMRAASSRPEAVAHLREIFISRMMLPMMTELGLSRPRERAVMLAVVVTGMSFLHELLEIRTEWPDLEGCAELALLTQTIELVLTIDLD